MREINEIIIHCSFTPETMDIGVEEITDWHVNGNGWDDIGYHWLIRRNGEVEKGRDESVVGAHARGHNYHSIGICLVGGKDGDTDRSVFNFNKMQMNTLDELVAKLIGQYPDVGIIGHRDVSSKDCPCFDVKTWFKNA